MDSGNAAWMLMAASMVFLMTPAVAFFYGGMVRRKAILNMLMLSAGALAVGSLVWTLWGWSIAYAGRDVGGLGIFGDPSTGFLLRDAMKPSKDGVFTATTLNANGKYPVSIDVAFQMAFAMIAVALITGALAERIKYSTWLIFTALWLTFDYAPMDHMVWNGGLLSPTGAISKALGAAAHDFAGGTVIHINAAVAALVIVLIIGKRKGFGSEAIRPHNVPFVMLGAFLLWFGWFGFNAGSAFAANGTAGYAWVSTSVAAGAAMLAWGFTERIRSGHYTALGAASGMVAGLVAITPAADVVSPLWAMVIGAVAGVLTCLACGLKFRFGYDDSLDVVGVHGVGGLTGTVLVGLFGAGAGLFTGGSWRQLAVQTAVALVAVAYSAVVTFVIAFALQKTVGWRVSDADEVLGVDLADQGESAYDALAASILGTQSKVWSAKRIPMKAVCGHVKSQSEKSVVDARSAGSGHRLPISARQPGRRPSALQSDHQSTHESTHESSYWSIHQPTQSPAEEQHS